MATNPGERAGGTALARCLLGLVLLTLGLGTALAQPASVSARLATGTISIDESVSLVVEASGLDGELDVAALEENFEVVSRSSSRDVSILNGERRSTVTWVLELVPREVGVFTVPPVSVGGIESELLSLTVTEAPTGGEREVFVEASVDTDTPWVQSQVILTLRVFRAIDIVDGALGEPLGEGLEVRALGDDRSYTDRRDGRDYVVVERRFALFPQRSGPLAIEPITLTVTVPSDPSRVRGFFSPTRRLTRRTREIPLAVRARPADAGGWWLPAKAVSLTEDWPGAGEARVGEPLTRTVRVEASGVLAAQLPAVEPPSVDGLALYADDPARVDEVGAGGVRASQTLSLAVIPSREGEFELPPVRLDWFDVTRGEPRTAVLPARSITVLPGNGGAAPPSPAAGGAPTVDERANERAKGGEAADTRAIATDAPTEEGGGIEAGGGRWRVLALGAFVGWTLTAVALALTWRSRRRARAPRRETTSVASATPSEREARQRLQAAARDGNASAVAAAALARAAVRWPGSPPRNLAALAARLEPAAALGKPLAALDAALYRRDADGEATPDGEALSALAERLERALQSAPPPGERDAPPGGARALPPL